MRAAPKHRGLWLTKIDHPYFVALQAHPEFCSRPLNPSPPFLGLIAAACGGSVLEEKLAENEQSYVDPHPESAKVVPASEAVTDAAKGKKQEVGGVRVQSNGTGNNTDADLQQTEERLRKVTLQGKGETA